MITRSVGKAVHLKPIASNAPNQETSVASGSVAPSRGERLNYVYVVHPDSYEMIE